MKPLSNKQKAQLEKQKRETAKREKRNADVAAKRKAEQEALDAGLKWDDTIVARKFGEDYDAAYKLATAGGPETEENLRIKREAQAKFAQDIAKIRTETATTEEKPVEEKPVEEKPVGDKKARRLSNAELTAAAAKTALLGTSAGEAVQYDSSKAEATTEEEQHVDQDLVDAGSFKELTKRQAEEAAKSAPVEESRDEPVIETKTETKAERKARIKAEKQKAAAAAIAEAGAKLAAEQQADELVAQMPGLDRASVVEGLLEGRNGNAPVETETKDNNVDTQQTPEQPEEHNDAVEAPVEKAEPEAAPVEAKPDSEQAEGAKPDQEAAPVKPTLVVNNPVDEGNHTDDHRAGAKKFYGKAFTKERAIYLTEAYRLLNMAIKAEAKMKPGSTAIENTFARAVDMEARAFGAVAAPAMAA